MAKYISSTEGGICTTPFSCVAGRRKPGGEACECSAALFGENCIDCNFLPDRPRCKQCGNRRFLNVCSYRRQCQKECPPYLISFMPDSPFSTQGRECLVPGLMLVAPVFEGTASCTDDLKLICGKCDAQGHCIQCLNHLYEFEGKCLLVCPSGYHGATDGRCLAY